MAVYVIAQLSFTDRKSYDRYQGRFWDVFKNFDGRLLAADENPKILEGKWDCNKLVMMSFPDEEASRKFLGSPEYQEIAVDRKKGAEAVVLLVQGISRNT